MSFAEKLKQARIKMELTQEDVAKAIRVSKRTLIEYETGRSEPKVSTLKQLASYLCVTVNELISEPYECQDKAEQYLMSSIGQMGDEEKEILVKLSEALLMKSRMKQISQEAEETLQEEGKIRDLFGENAVKTNRIVKKVEQIVNDTESEKEAAFTLMNEFGLSGSEALQTIKIIKSKEQSK
ncbi:helix-turn-helix transcriptional regulator [Vibrio mangrovi]|uniref:HTH-type transcriptional regulator Xre n=1 Tax=Vibrio mangrovi TaxID=474394 RepID=A0A1Y6ISY9_9VIBR|nr:helix-turn-helix transcriptional regulator [Vibrio mangrovi]MDW6004446.1 helix-turn-helix transcriptional regulator [Vibrio mangrovi]MDW6004460.1 helix-turn-helix transcriptional regulator [Vibrio mangrovi]SMS00748.1 HTH-type transcriptional regulator Xre [Vibrio mangrovi]